jgi:hypothetical protein
LFCKYLLLEELIHLHEVVRSFVLRVSGEAHLGRQSFALLHRESSFNINVFLEVELNSEAMKRGFFTLMISSGLVAATSSMFMPPEADPTKTGPNLVAPRSIVMAK